MSLQFGRWNFDGKPLTPDCMDKVHAALGPYTPDRGDCYVGAGISVIYRPFHTTRESRSETQPYLCTSGSVLTWDGRLDNRADLSSQLKGNLVVDSPDILIVSAAYQRWGTACFAKLVGDWALSIWDPADRTLLLAKDHIGARQLYYLIEKRQVTWSTLLDPLVLLGGSPPKLDEEYLAGWLSFFPASYLTPYMGIQSVPASSYVRIGSERRTVQEYWRFDPGKRIQYRNDTDYEEHFRSVFAESVKRRTHSDIPVLAELSGGLDSSSIVCMADTLTESGVSKIARVDTVSYYDDSEPNWNERPYFESVENKRHRVGCHINIAPRMIPNFDFNHARFCATPDAACHDSGEGEEFSDYVMSHGNRVLLSGIGGDEVMGGVPTPIPELSDLLARARLADLAHQLKIWALSKRKPWFQLLMEAVKEFVPPLLLRLPERQRPSPWLRADFIKRQRSALLGYPTRLKLFGALPSFQENLSTLNVLRRQLACTALSSNPHLEKRYPFLDRDLLEYIYAIPREQLVRPGARRSLMRRSLRTIVPEDVLNRRRKAFVVRAPLAFIRAHWERLIEMNAKMICSALGIVDSTGFLEALCRARRGEEIPIVFLMRTLVLELWLRGLHSPSSPVAPYLEIEASNCSFAASAARAVVPNGAP